MRRRVPNPKYARKDPGRAALIEMYNNRQMSQNAIAKELKCSPQAVPAMLARHRIASRWQKNMINKIPESNPSFNPDCPACVERRIHTKEEQALHPFMGHGYSPESGWTHPDLKKEGK